MFDACTSMCYCFLRASPIEILAKWMVIESWQQVTFPTDVHKSNLELRLELLTANLTTKPSLLECNFLNFTAILAIKLKYDILYLRSLLFCSKILYFQGSFNFKTKYQGENEEKKKRQGWLLSSIFGIKKFFFHLDHAWLELTALLRTSPQEKDNTNVLPSNLTVTKQLELENGGTP